jgi:hypothetical protein
MKYLTFYAYAMGGYLLMSFVLSLIFTAIEQPSKSTLKKTDRLDYAATEILARWTRP